MIDNKEYYNKIEQITGLTLKPHEISEIMAHIEETGHGMDLVYKAYEYANSTGKSMSAKYIIGILRAWKRDNNISTVEDLQNYFENKGYIVVYTDAKNSNNLNKVIDKAKEELAEKIARQVAKGIKPRAIRSMVIGVPNVGKSTFINKLIKKNVANTANKPGVTKKQQWLKLNKDIELLDTPGILMPKFDNQEIGKKLSLIGSIKDDITPLDDVSLYLIELLKNNYLENLNNHYKLNVKAEDENLTIMEKIAEKRFKKIGGDYDYDSTIKLLIQDFRTQKFGLITLDNYNEIVNNEESYED